MTNVCIAASSDQYKSSVVVFHAYGYTVYDPHSCQQIRHISADFDLSVRRSTRLQLTSASALRRYVTGNTTSTAAMLCDVTCGWGDAVTVNSKLIYVSQPSRRRVIVIDAHDQHRPIEVFQTAEI